MIAVKVWIKDVANVLKVAIKSDVAQAARSDAKEAQVAIEEGECEVIVAKSGEIAVKAGIAKSDGENLAVRVEDVVVVTVVLAGAGNAPTPQSTSGAVVIENTGAHQAPSQTSDTGKVAADKGLVNQTCTAVNYHAL